MNQMNHERASFGAALRDAAESFTVPQAEEMHERALRRGRQIKRRKAAGASVSAAVMVGAVGVLTAGLLGFGTSGPAPGESTSGVHPTGTPSAVPAGTALARYMADHLQESLPKGAALKTGSGVASLTGSGYAVFASNGLWRTYASANVTYAGQAYGIELDVTRQDANPTCGSPPFNGSCTSKPLGRGTLVSNVRVMASVDLTWEYSWNLADGASIGLRVYAMKSTSARNPYTEQQIESIITAPAWTMVVDGLPQIVHCDNLQHVVSKTSGPEWKCPSTGVTYPGPVDGSYATGF